jgi:UDP-N-acetylmuramyl pentapeptide phosphotransferase/UDP-N-acetylglucosamine-1-phosphate transferase
MTALLLAGVFIFAVGFVDDVRGVRALHKLVALVVAALAVCASGARIDSIGLGEGLTLELGVLSWPVTVLWIVAVTVAINFIDGLDGLAAGVSAIVCGTIALLALCTGQIVMGVLMLALLGSLTGFLFFNFNPAKVFMGDGGAMFLGFMISAGSVVATAKVAMVAGIAVPAVALGIPLLDAALTMVRRGVLDRRSVFAAERGHIHHRLLDMGLSQRSAVLILYAASLATAAMAMALLLVHSGWAVLFLGGVLVSLLLLFHCVGASRLRETLGVLKRHAATARELKEEKGHFEDAQLRFREADSIDAWWAAACHLADTMQFERLAMTHLEDEAASSTYVWQRSAEPISPREVVMMTLPVRNGLPVASIQLELGIRVGSTLETVGRRVMLFTRLLDECMSAHMLDREWSGGTRVTVNANLDGDLRSGERLSLEADMAVKPHNGAALSGIRAADADGLKNEPDSPGS